MIRSLLHRVRDWSPFVRFAVLATTAVSLFDLLVNQDLQGATRALYAGATMIAVGEYIAPIVSTALFSYIHERTKVPAYCGDPVAPTAGDWHHAITGTIGTYVFIALSTAVLRQDFSSEMLLGALLFMAPWAGVFLFLHLLFQTIHFLGHRRSYRIELESEREWAAREDDITQTFWGMVRDHKSDPGSVA